MNRRGFIRGLLSAPLIVSSTSLIMTNTLIRRPPMVVGVRNIKLTFGNSLHDDIIDATGNYLIRMHG